MRGSTSDSSVSVRQSLLVVAMLLLAWLAWMLRELVILIGFAALLAVALDPLVGLVCRIPLPRRRAMPRGLAAGIVMLALVAIVGWAMSWVLPRLVHEVSRLIEAAPEAIAKIDRELRPFLARHGWSGVLSDAGGPASRDPSPLLHTIQQWSMSLLGGLFGNLRRIMGLVLLPVLAFYLLADRDAVRSSSMGFVPDDLRPQADRLLAVIEPPVRDYVRGQALVCLVMGSVVAAELQMLGFPVALLLGLTVAAAEVVPFIGAWAAATAIGFAGYSVSPTLALTGIGAYVATNVVLGYTINPRLMAHAIKMHPFVVIVSILAGTALLGPPGAVLALPGAAVIQAIVTDLARKPVKHGA